ncbi:MAG: GxxExxY protein [Acidobacteria bacterium]|nr:GxxExxY protein [Acidobacteriota bacterium]
MKHEELTSKILECCFEVSNEMGIGFVESIYERSLTIALTQKGVDVRAQVPLKVQFRGIIVGNFIADLIVSNKVLVELKAVSRVAPEHKAQTINYLNATSIEVGLLVNFGTPRLEYYRMIPSRDYPADPVHPV